MADQAATLRRLMQSRSANEASKKITQTKAPTVLTVASGKGGVGKSFLTANLGAHLARAGLRVLLVDGDYGLANLEILLGVQGTVTLEQVIGGEAKIQEAIVGIEPGLWLLPSSTGISAIRSADDGMRVKLAEIFSSLPWDMDLILVDAGAGIQDNVLSLHSPYQESVIVLTPEPTSLTDAYGLMKVLRRTQGILRMGVIVNRVTDGGEGVRTFQRIREVANRFLDIDLEYVGHCPTDEKITQSVMKRKILLDLDSGASTARCLELLAKRLRTVGKSQGLRSDCRFREEPAPYAPRNAAEFFKSLLGEEKA